RASTCAAAGYGVRTATTEGELRSLEKPLLCSGRLRPLESEEEPLNHCRRVRHQSHDRCYIRLTTSQRNKRICRKLRRPVVDWTVGPPPGGFIGLLEDDLTWQEATRSGIALLSGWHA